MARRGVTRREPATADEYAAAIRGILTLLDGIGSARVGHRKAKHLQLLHGLAMQSMCMARAALLLIDNGMVAEAAPLVRVALEHAVAIQWILIVPNGADEFVRHASFKNSKYRQVVEAVGIAVPQ